MQHENLYRHVYEVYDTFVTAKRFLRVLPTVRWLRNVLARSLIFKGDVIQSMTEPCKNRAKARRNVSTNAIDNRLSCTAARPHIMTEYISRRGEGLCIRCEIFQ